MEDKSLVKAIKDLTEQVAYIPDTDLLMKAIDELNETLKSIDQSIKALTEKISAK